MRRQMTMLAAAIALAGGYEGTIEDKSSNPIGENPFWMPTRSRRIKNKINRKKYGK